ncbi:DUF2062 domain-containing protein [Azoarcus sp. PA01]|nr:DUF2062 domain-containing protein [Azoarcus sp. PA01]
MRKILKRFLPKHETIRSNRWLRPFASTLLHPRLWHLNRHSAAGGFAVGLFCGMIPGPLQAGAAAICCLVFRVNLPLAIITTLYSNPVTIVPLYFLAYKIGSWAMGINGQEFAPPPELGELTLIAWGGALVDWMAGLGKPLGLGLILLAATLSLLGYLAVKAAWRIWLIRTWHGRRTHRNGG